ITLRRGRPNRKTEGPMPRCRAVLRRPRAWASSGPLVERRARVFYTNQRLGGVVSPRFDPAASSNPRGLLASTPLLLCPSEVANDFTEKPLQSAMALGRRGYRLERCPRDGYGRCPDPRRQP